MQITIGEYTTRNGCRAIVDDNDLVTGLLSGTVILPGNMSQVRVWWNREGFVCFPDGNWSNRDDEGFVFKSNHSLWSIRYSAKTYWNIISTPSP